MEIKKELINKTLGRDFVDESQLDDYWVVLIGNKIFAPTCSRMFHESKESAWKHFYNEYNWRIKSDYKTDKYGHDYWRKSVNRTETDTQIWNAFKTALYCEYDFRIVQWKDAKENVCSKA
jgi:hypothetical protein